MSAPKRYEPNSSTFVVMLCRDHGEYVLYSDYAALVAENERLRKAGDAMHRAIKVSDYALDWAIEVWLAAKEGGRK